jgi:chromosome segregation ATPase
VTDRRTSWPARIPGARFGHRVVDRFVRNRVAEGLAELFPRLDAVDRRLEAMDRRLAEMASLVDVHEQSRHEHWARIHELNDERIEVVQRQDERIGRLQFDIDRISPVLSALEVRVERLHRELADAPAGVPDDDARAGDLLAEARREHEQVRVRLSAIAAYEERLRRIEAAAGAGPVDDTQPVDNAAAGQA